MDLGERVGKIVDLADGRGKRTKVVEGEYPYELCRWEWEYGGGVGGLAWGRSGRGSLTSAWDSALVAVDRG